MSRSFTLSLLLSICHIVLAGSQSRADDCSATSDLSQMNLLERIAKAEEQRPQAQGGKADGVAISLAANVVVLRRGAGTIGDIPQAELTAWLASTTASFKSNGAPFVITAQRITYVDVDQATYDLQRGSTQEAAITSQHLRGGKSSLNIFVMGAGASAGGWSSVDVVKNTGVFALYDWDKRAFNSPTGLVHEIGHWLGLQHPFEWGCGEVLHGDLIRDTPTQAQSARVCGPADTCTDDDGDDPSDNIMGYGLECRSTFTPGQVRRMINVWRWVRLGKGDEFVVDEENPPANDAGCTVGGNSGGHAACGILLVALMLRRRRTATKPKGSLHDGFAPQT
jgi:hypothetical protein